MKPTIVLVFALFVASVGGQLPAVTTTATASASSSTQVPKCVLDCAEFSITSSGTTCKSIDDPCICTDTKFITAMSKCLKLCSTADQLAAKNIENSICGGISSSSSTATTTNGNSGSSATATATGSATRSGAAAASASATGSGTPTASGTTTGSGTPNIGGVPVGGGSDNTGTTGGNATSPASSSASHSGNGGLAVQFEFGQGSIFALTCAVAGAIMGGLLI